MKTQRVLWIGIPPSPIWQGLENLQRDVGAGLLALGGEIARRPLWLLGTQVRCLQDSPQYSPRGDRMLLDELAARTEHAAEVLRPRPVAGRVENDTATAIKSTDLASRELGPTLGLV
jgi:hypothetical protein